MDRLEGDLDTDDDIDWDDIIATTQPDIDAGIYAFTTDGCTTDEEVMEAIWNWLCTLGNGGADETTPEGALHTKGE
jgi:hypothetical protein